MFSCECQLDCFTNRADTSLTLPSLASLCPTRPRSPWRSTGRSRTRGRHGNDVLTWPGGPPPYPLPLSGLDASFPGAPWASLGRFEWRLSRPWPRRLSCSGRHRLQRAYTFTCYRASGDASQMTCLSIHWCVHANFFLWGKRWRRCSGVDKSWEDRLPGGCPACFLLHLGFVRSCVVFPV